MPTVQIAGALLFLIEETAHPSRFAEVRTRCLQGIDPTLLALFKDDERVGWTIIFDQIKDATTLTFLGKDVLNLFAGYGTKLSGQTRIEPHTKPLHVHRAIVDFIRIEATVDSRTIVIGQAHTSVSVGCACSEEWISIILSQDAVIDAVIFSDDVALDGGSADVSTLWPCIVEEAFRELSVGTIGYHQLAAGLKSFF